MFEMKPRPAQFEALNKWDFVGNEKAYQKMLKSQTDGKGC